MGRAEAGDAGAVRGTGGLPALGRVLHVVLPLLGLASVSLVIYQSDVAAESEPRTSFTRVSGDTRADTAAEAAELWPVARERESVAAPTAATPASQWAAARCAAARPEVVPLRWTSQQPTDRTADCEDERVPRDDWNVYATPTTRALGLDDWVPQSPTLHPQVIVVSPTDPVPTGAGTPDTADLPQAPDVAVAVVLAAHLARDEGTPTTVVVVPRYLESDRSLEQRLRRDGSVIRQGILLGGPRRVSDGARELIRQVTTPAPALSRLEKVDRLLGPFGTALLALLTFFTSAAALGAGAVLLAGSDGTGGRGWRGFWGGLLGGERFHDVVERRQVAAATRGSPAAGQATPQDGPGRRDEAGDAVPADPVTPATTTEETSTVRITPPRPTPSAPHEVVELRVHGVHGTSPASMLGVGDGDVGRVAGDDLTGIYRLRQGDPPLRSITPGPEETRPPVSVEAYSWGALTSGVQGFLGWVRRSLWLLLLPFALVNLAYWARVDLATEHLRARLGARAVRAAGLLLTVFFVLTPCLVFVDLGAWQCFRYGVPSCERLPGWTDGLAGLTPGQRVAVASVGPMLVLAVLWFLSRTTVTRYEEVGEAPPGIRPGDALPADRPVLRHPALWRGRDRTRGLARRHLAAGVATVALFLGQHLLVTGRLSSVEQVLVLALVGVGWVTLLACLLLVLVPHADDVDPPGPPSAWLRTGDRVRDHAPTLDLVVGGLALATYAALVLLLWTGAGADLDQDSAWVGRTFWFLAVFVAVTLLHLVVFTGGRMPLPVAFGVVGLVLGGFAVLVWAEETGRYGPDDGTTVAVVGVVAVAIAVGLGVWHYRYGRGRPEVQARAWRGAGPSVLLAAGAWVALLFTSASVVATADFLNGTDHGVGDLVSTTKVETEEFQEEQRSPVQRTAARTTYAAAGDVVVHHARLVRGDDGDVVVTAGQVSADGFWRAARAGVTGKRFGRTEVGSESGLRLPGTTLLTDYSCLDAAPTTGRCTAEDLAFRGSSRIVVPEGATVTLAPGVVLDPAESPQAPLAIPPVLLWMPLAQLLWLAIVVFLVLPPALRRFSRGAGRGIVLVGGGPDDDLPHRDRPACLQARRRAALAHRAERLLDLVGLVTSLVALPVVVLAMTGAAPWQLEGAAWTRGLADLGMYLVVGLSALLIGLGSRMRRSESTRKAVGVLWDLTTFWPRAAHPLAPPCYAERVVPELLQRSRWVLDRDPGNLLVLSGHSQGSLIVVAVASRLSDKHLARVRLVTYGSQVRALYGRVFPGVVGAEAVGYAPTPGVTRLGDPFPDVPAAEAPPVVDPATGSLRGRLLANGGTWVNLFRRTDPLGFRVFGDVDGEAAAPWDRSQDLPVPEVPPGEAGDPGPRVMGHGGYQHTLTYRRVVATWTGERVVDDPVGTHGVPTHPPG